MKTQDIEQKICSAISNAVPKQLVDAYERKEKETLQAFLNGKMEVEELSNKINALGKGLNFIAFYNPEELHYALSYMNIPAYQMESVLQEQIPYYHQTIRQGLPARFGVVVYRYSDGKLGAWVKNETRIIQQMNQQVLRAALQRLARL